MSVCARVGHLVLFTSVVRHGIERSRSYGIGLMKEFQLMKSSFKVDNPIASRVDRYEL